jgi:hypothetical protein
LKKKINLINFLKMLVRLGMFRGAIHSGACSTMMQRRWQSAAAPDVHVDDDDDDVNEEDAVNEDKARRKEARRQRRLKKLETQRMQRERRSQHIEKAADKRDKRKRKGREPLDANRLPFRRGDDADDDDGRYDDPMLSSVFNDGAQQPVRVGKVKQQAKKKSIASKRKSAHFNVDDYDL